MRFCTPSSSLINANDKKAVRSILKRKGFAVNDTEEGILELKSEEAIKQPDIIATILVNAACPPTLLQLVLVLLQVGFSVVSFPIVP
ncbi:MAG: hypothetical protein GXO83_08585 [Chlorobi bacterium]|nr:hypothetical protein [Chlorobiota bacterium]